MRIPAAGTRDDALVATYTNKLDQFRSYSYYHIIGVCRSDRLESVLSVFEDVSKVKTLLATPTPKDAFGYRHPSYVDNIEQPDKKFFILCNGVMDVDLVVDSLVTQVDIANPKIQTGANALVSLSGEIVIREPKGIRFLNIYRQICNELRTTAYELRLVIKTVFVGDTDNGEVGYVLDMPPICGVISDFKVNVNEAGSVYTAALNSVVGRIAYDAQISSSTNGQLVKGNGSIREALNSLALAYTNDASNNLKRLIPSMAAGKVAMEYVIEIDDSIKQAGDWNIKMMRNARLSSHNGAQPMVIPANVSIDGAIAYIFEACADYLAQAVSGATDSFIYKIVSVMHTSEAGVKAVYRIVPQFHNRYGELNSKLKASTDPELVLSEQDNVIVYDYIFTGKNTDVESFDMSINEGIGYFGMITTVETYSDSYAKGPTVTVGTTATSEVNSPNPTELYGTYGSVGPGSNSAQQRSADQRLTKLKEEYDATYDKVWTIQAAKQAAILKTRGHTGWLSLFAANPYKVVQDKQNIITDIPAVYLNIMMPGSYSGALPQDITKPDTYEKFWYKGLWSVLKVVNTMTDGTFTTELEMLAIITNSAQNPSNSKPLQSALAGNPSPETRTQPVVTPIPVEKSTFVVGTSNGQLLLATTTNDTNITPDFKLRDFTKTSKVAVGQNQPSTQDILDNIVNTATVLQYIKDQLKITINIGSGYRNDVVNKAVGGADTSDHRVGEAVDFTSPQMTPDLLIAAIMKLGISYKQLILEKPTNRSPWIHLAVSRRASANTNVTRVWDGSKYLPYTA